MRISSLYHSSAMLHQMNNNGARLSKLMEQMATQKRVNVPSDDPVASSRLVQLNREQSAIDQYQSNITRLSGNLSIQESHVTALSEQLLALNDKLLAASNDTYSEKDMGGFANEMSQMLESLVSTMNAKNEDGHYIFSGTKTNTQPVVFDEASKTYLYAGNDASRATTVANGIEIAENTNISQAFSGSNNDLSMLNLLKTVSDKMATPGADYRDDLKLLLGEAKKSSDSIASVYTELGGKQNRLTLIGDAHSDVKISHEQVIQELSALDAATSYVNIQMYTQAVQASNKSFMMISQLSLFNQM
ncbi:flagellar hook-associated protein 3 [Buttiauxella warmboldiae]|uniref:Flagellar hook-associated protein 3 n=1 Tax=Buttiauxella warmboldiae TaxID=82993 RepID=A0A3N5DQF7_9ENTR|nr:flagellar hook-associated protein FlgL [Buttiauxella warmboldiae]RPH29441.1 flagellar hook-associated protein 3 [Buttiauxella warmboldiae]